MNIHDYLSMPNAIRASQLAKRIGVSPVLISQWSHGVRRVPAERCPSIERATDGAVRCESLRPDVDWAYLRGARRGDLDFLEDAS